MLHFYYGVMGSSKTAMLLMQRYNYIAQDLHVALVKPAIDTRIDHNTVYSRVGLTASADIVLGSGHSIREQLSWLAIRNGINDFPYIFVDEAQFLTKEQVQADFAIEAEERVITAQMLNEYMTYQATIRCTNTTTPVGNVTFTLSDLQEAIRDIQTSSQSYLQFRADMMDRTGDLRELFK